MFNFFNTITKTGSHTVTGYILHLTAALHYTKSCIFER